MFPKEEGSGAFRRPGSSRHWAQALGGSGSAHRAGWFKGSYIVSLRREAVFSKARGFRRLWRPGSSRHWAHALGYGQAVRCSLNGQAMLAYEPDLRFLCRNRTSSAHRAGRFRGSYICCLRQHCREAAYILIARRAIPQPFEPSEPSEPSEPGPRRGPIYSSNDTPPVPGPRRFLF